MKKKLRIISEINFNESVLLQINPRVRIINKIYTVYLKNLVLLPKSRFEGSVGLSENIGSQETKKATPSCMILEIKALTNS